MGVPALFRWLSKKYPKIILPVVEEEERKFTDEDGGTTTIPINFSTPNPNGVEFDNLYLDMNGIVHPCTHPEGKAAPETEEEMMVEVFKYTERVVNMIRPRKLLMIAIDGVAPRAKMNQQRSRRFRASQEAKEKEEARQESFLLWESMGQTVTDEMRNKKSWDSNAITPGTPFMDLLAQSIRYWIVQKMNTDPGWKELEVIISDASVPGEGEHKIMDFIRRQRSNYGHDPNTQHVIYGLDADLIMLSLATHEPNFRVLREDVFFQDTSPTACRICGQEGHYAAQCTGEKKIKADEHDTKNTPIEKKPFIFLDVSILREYLEIELDIPNAPFPFDIERAIDDWVLLIFFVGNDFLPHLPSLEIREGAIDTLLKIWKDELPRMGGYITNHGNLEYARTEIILEGLAKREDEIFRRRREGEERQEQNTKRRKMEADARKNVSLESVKPAASLQLTGNPSAPPAVSNPYGLPPRPNFDSFENSANSLGFGTPVAASTNTKAAVMATIAGGSTSDWVDKRREIRMANLSAAEMLKAEMMSAVPVNPAARKQYMARMRSEAVKTDVVEESVDRFPAEPVPVKQEEPYATVKKEGSDTAAKEEEPDMDVDKKSTVTDGTVTSADEQPIVVDPPPEANQLEERETVPGDASANGDLSPVGIKRKADELEDAEGEDDEDFDLGPDDEEDTTVTSPAVSRKVNADGTVDQEDTVKLWEPGYKERYYKQKFGVEANDLQFRKKITTAYVEGMAWVLAYYYQGTPSWTWYYPFHFAPFAQDFVEVSRMDISFNKGQPFKPFEQLMGVFPPASRHHIPEVFHSLMTESDSPIIDFYPETFEIDMNGKKMAWQGVALLPFIDEKRLLDAMAPRYGELSEDEHRRNKWGSNVLYVADEHPLYPLLESLYAKRKDDKPVPIDPKQGRGLNGTLLPDPACVPGSTFESPLTSQGFGDIVGDRSLAALYFFPKQVVPHHSALLPGVRRPARVLTRDDSERIRRGDRGRPRGAGFHDINSGRGGGRGPPRNGYNGAQSYGGYSSNGGRDGYGGSGSGAGGYRGYGGGYKQYGETPPPRGRGRGDSGRPNYGGPASHSTYGATPMSDYNRPSNSYYQGGGANGYNRPPPTSSYGSSSGGYGRGRGGYQPNSYNQPSTYSQGYSNNSGYGSNSRDRYGGQVAGNSNYGGYGGDRGGGTSSGYGGYGSGRGGGGNASQYNQPQGGYGGYGRGAPPPSSNYNARGRGYGRY